MVGHAYLEGNRDRPQPSALWQPSVHFLVSQCTADSVHSPFPRPPIAMRWCGVDSSWLSARLHLCSVGNEKLELSPCIPLPQLPPHPDLCLVWQNTNDYEHHSIISPLNRHKLQQASLLITLPNKPLRSQRLRWEHSPWQSRRGRSIFLCPRTAGSDPRWAAKPHTLLINAHIQLILLVEEERKQRERRRRRKEEEWRHVDGFKEQEKDMERRKGGWPYSGFSLSLSTTEVLQSVMFYRKEGNERQLGMTLKWITIGHISPHIYDLWTRFETIGFFYFGFVKVAVTLRWILFVMILNIILCWFHL